MLQFPRVLCCPQQDVPLKRIQQKIEHCQQYSLLLAASLDSFVLPWLISDQVFCCLLLLVFYLLVIRGGNSEIGTVAVVPVEGDDIEHDAGASAEANTVKKEAFDELFFVSVVGLTGAMVYVLSLMLFVSVSLFTVFIGFYIDADWTFKSLVVTITYLMGLKIGLPLVRVLRDAASFVDDIDVEGFLGDVGEEALVATEEDTGTDEAVTVFGRVIAYAKGLKNWFNENFDWKSYGVYASLVLLFTEILELVNQVHYEHI